MKAVEALSRWSVLVALAACSSSSVPGADAAAGDGGDARAGCAAGVDSDGDGASDADECRAGSDPSARDSDMDGVSDGAELAYPRACVADDRARQRRPPPTCMADAQCLAGERCRGLDPTRRDSDGDGVADNEEDRLLDRAIEARTGETDPRLWDTDGDGITDGVTTAICRTDGLAAVTQVTLPMTGVQVGYDPRFGASRLVAGSEGRAAVLLDDPSAAVAGLVVSLPAAGDVNEETSRVRAAIAGELRLGTNVFLGRALTTHEGHPALPLTWVVERAGSASALRDALIRPLTGAAAPAGGAEVGAAGAFVVEATVTRRATGMTTMRTDVIVAVAPRAAYDDIARPTGVRATDLVNTTGVAEAQKALDAACDVFRAPPTPPVDFLWTVDVSVSTAGRQQSIGATAERFFARLRAAGVDFRVAVLAAQPEPFDFATPGLHWVSGDDPMGPRELAFRVTTERYQMDAADLLAPYPNPGRFAVDESPIFAAVNAHDQLSAAPAGAPADRRLRPGARVAVFFVGDESGLNDDRRFAQDAARWGRTYNDRLPAVARYFSERHILTFGLVNDGGPGLCDPQGASDMRRCVILANRGAYAVIGRATDADIELAMARIVSAIVGDASPYALTRSPITSTLKVRVRDVDVPRSRADGFDYDPASRAVVFYGSTFRPRGGDPVAVSYRGWQGSPG
jgi:hypothetical protein